MAQLWRLVVWKPTGAAEVQIVLAMALRSHSLSTKFEVFAKRPLAFRCNPALPWDEASGDVRKVSAKRRKAVVSEFIAEVEHRLSPPASGDELRLLDYVLGSHAPTFRAVYARHNGAKLYRDTRSKPPLSKTVGVELLPIRRWKSATQAMKRIVGRCALDRYNVLFGVAFGWVPGSENFFVALVQGPRSGEIFYTHGDGAFVSPFAKSFEGFINRITTRPVKLLTDDLGGYACYQDGQTFEQWLPFAVSRGSQSLDEG